MNNQTVLDRLSAERDGEIAAIDAIMARDDFDPADPALMASRERVETLNRAIEQRVEFEQLRATGDRLAAAAGRVARREKSPAEQETGSLGDLFTRSNVFAEYRGVGTSSRFSVDVPLTRNLINSTTEPGSVFVSQPVKWVPPQPSFTNPLLGLANIVSVSTGSVEWVELPPRAPLAGVVAEGDLKPEATLTATTKSDSLKTIAHWIPVARQTLEDGPQVRSWIDGQLVRGVNDKVEALAADALTGATLGSATGADLLGAIRAGIAQVQANGWRPSAIAINPNDAAQIDLAIMAGTLGGAAINGSVFGVQLVPVAAVPAGAPIVGDFAAGLTVFTRSNTEVFITDSHSDYFVRNQFVILAERRALAAVTIPDALVVCGTGAFALDSTDPASIKVG